MDSRLNRLENLLRNLLTNAHFVSILVLVFLWVIFFWRLYTPVQEDRFIFPQGDFTEHYYAASSYQADRQNEGEIALWNPYNHAGSPFAADPQSAVFYPPRWISILVSSGNAWTLADFQREVAAHYLLSSLLMYAFLRVVTNRSSAAIVGSVIFTYGGYLTAYPMLQVSILQSAVWLPMILLGMYLSLRHEKWAIRGVLLAALGMGLSILGGHPQTNLHVGYISLAYLLFMGYRLQKPIKGIVMRTILIYLIAVAIAAVQLLPSLEFTLLSSRVDQYTYIDKSSGFALYESLLLIYPDLSGEWSPLYVGVVGLLLGLGAMLRRTTDTLFWTVIAVLSLFVAFGNNSIVYDIFYLFLPGMGIFRQQERLAIGVSFALSVLAAYQVAWLIQRDRSAENLKLSTVEIVYRQRFQWIGYGHSAITVLVAIGFLFYRTMNPDVISESMLNIFFLVALISILFLLWQRWQATYQDSPIIIAAVLLVLIMIDLFTIGRSSPNFIANVPENYVQAPVALSEMQVEDADNIRWRVDGSGGIQQNGTYFKVPDIYGNSPLFLESIYELRQIPPERFWEVLSVRYLTTLDPIPPEVNAVPIAEGINYDDELYVVYDITNPRPIAHLVYDYINGDNAEEVRTIMSGENINLRETAVLLNRPSIDLPSERPEDTEITDFVSVTPEDFQMKVSTSENALLTFSIPHYPGWVATVDDREVEILDNYAGLMAIAIEGSDNPQRVRLQFQSQTVLWGSIVSSLTTLFVLGFIVFRSTTEAMEAEPEEGI